MPSLEELTDPSAVRQAIDRFDELGRDAFLRQHGFGPARRFWLVVDGKRYDSKAIAGVAWGFQYTGGTRWLQPSDFSGGDVTVRRKLEELGFSVVTEGSQVSSQQPSAAASPVGTGSGTETAGKTWIFQANPDAFDITGYLAIRPADLLWLVRQKGAHMEVGDQVFFWRAIGSGDRALSGVIAEAEIIEQPRTQADDAGAASFWVNKGGTADWMLPQERVRLRLLRVAEENNILNRDVAAANPILAGMQVLTGRTGTNFLLKPNEADALSALWASAHTVAIATATTTDPVEADIAAVQSDPSIPETTRLALIQARRGQGQFRAGLMRRWQGACAVTGLAVTQILRASHARPWRDSTNAERLDPNNGLLLAANLDALFDAGLISFDDDGAMLVSAALSVKDCSTLGLPAALRGPLTAVERAFLAFHRSMKFHR